MMKTIVIFATVSLAYGALGMASHTPVPPPPVEPPEGYIWVLNETYSDEFNGRKLDGDKWHDHYPGWKGRVPGLFVPETVRVKDGFLNIRIGLLDPPRGDDGEWWIACGAIQSRGQDAGFGYYETRMKASNLRTSSTFWLMNPQEQAKMIGKRTELDIQECIGDAQKWPDFKHQFRSNTHITFFNEEKVDGEYPVAKKGASHDIGSEVHQDFHTYGCWWVDEKTMHFYLDGTYVQTIEVSTEKDPAPFDQKMFVNLVCEIYDWEVLPEKEQILDDSRNTTYYDYVRAYTLMKIQ